MKDLSGKKVLIVGLGRSGISATRLLHAKKAEVILNDMKNADELETVLNELEGLFVEHKLGCDPTQCFDGIDLIVISPGVDFNQSWILEAQRVGIEIVSEIELAYWFCPCEIIAITGTNGKTTTTTLVGEIFKNAGRVTHVLGNIGVPFSSQVLSMKKEDICVCELSSFQILTSRTFSPNLFAFLNLSPDHLDKYGSMERYAESKAMMLDVMEKDSITVLNYKDIAVRSYKDRVRGRILWFSNNEKVVDGSFCLNNEIIFEQFGKQIKIMDRQEIKMVGEHNLENALAAIAIVMPFDVPAYFIRKTLMEFSGVAHRMEIVSSIGDVTFINDSKATNVDAALMAIRSMDRPTVLILGGFDKQTDFRPLFDGLNKMIEHIVVTGQTAEQLIKTAEQAGFENVSSSRDFEDAVYQAAMKAEKGYNVLLSPACASWDCFSDFEARGDCFKQIVERLK